MGTRKSTTGGQHSFAQIPSANIQRSSFDRSCGYKSTFDAGFLIPFFADEALPGDTMSMSLTAFGRLATPLHPIMDNMFMDTFFFFIPNRLLWENWQRFNGEQDNPTDSTDFLVPVINSGSGVLEGSIFDYFGIPTNIGNIEFSALWARAYALVWNEWFRDQNLQDSTVFNTDDGPDLVADYELLRRGKRHDYFTASLPFPQKGPAVTLSFGGTAPVTFPSGVDSAVTSTGAIPKWRAETDATSREIEGLGNPADARFTGGDLTPAESLRFLTPELTIDNTLGSADLSAATANTVNEIREAFQIQRLFERDARGGSRYTEIIRSHFGVVSPDQRLQRPEYLGGGSTRVNITPVSQTSESDTNTPQGNLAGFGTVTASGHGFHKSFVEHGIILGLISVRADLNYQQGLDRMWSRRTRFDFFWPALAHLGEQAVLSKEIYADGGSGDDDVWGYQERFGEYRYKQSKITGAMRSNAATPLDTWHLAQDFVSRPVLGEVFIEETPPIDRVIAVPTEPHFLLDCFFRFKCARPMPMYGVPGNIDRF